MELTVKLDESTINQLITGITEAIKNTPSKDDQLYNLTEICKILNISRNTMKTKDLPCSRVNKKGRKLYSLPDIKRYLKIGR